MQATILIVDDHKAFRSSLRDWLGTVFPSCHVIEAASGEESIDIAKEMTPSVVLMDIGLPGMNGIEATRCIKAAVPATRIVMLTIHEDNSYRADAADAGASAFVPKRTMQKELIPIMTNLLSKDGKNKGDVLWPLNQFQRRNEQ